MRLLWLSMLVLPIVCLGQNAPEQPAHVGTATLSVFPLRPQSFMADSVFAEPTRPTRAPTPSAPAPVQPLLATRAREPMVPKQLDHKKLWFLLTAAQHGSAVFDAWSTRAALENGRGYERDTLLKPFADSNAIYPALQVLPLGLDFISRRMMSSSHAWVRKTWWVPQTVSTTGFLWSASRNLRVAQLR